MGSDCVIPDHCLSFYFFYFRAGCSKQICSRAGKSKLNVPMWPE